MSETDYIRENKQLHDTVEAMEKEIKFNKEVMSYYDRLNKFKWWEFIFYGLQLLWLNIYYRIKKFFQKRQATL